MATASSRIVEQADGTFKPTRTSTTESHGQKSGFKEQTKLDIVRPGRYYYNVYTVTWHPVIVTEKIN